MMNPVLLSDMKFVMKALKLDNALTLRYITSNNHAKTRILAVIL